jgi:REP element-mobilizing transposase RayT
MRSESQLGHRRSIRLPGYDYSQPGGYFVTLCAHERELLFGEINDNEMMPNRLGKSVTACWQQLPRHFPDVELDAWVLMPNHFHGVIIIHERTVGGGEPRRGEAFAQNSEAGTHEAGQRLASQEDVIGPRANASPLHPGTHSPPKGTTSGSLGAMIQNFKSVSARRVNAIRRTPGAPVWQRNYYEHIIRNQQSLDEIREYIATNPARWSSDHENRTPL